MKFWLYTSIFLLFYVGTCVLGEEQATISGSEARAYSPLQQKVKLPALFDRDLAEVLITVDQATRESTTPVAIHLITLCHHLKDKNDINISMPAGEYAIADILLWIQHFIPKLTWSVFQNNIDVCLPLVDDIPNPFITPFTEDSELSLGLNNFSSWFRGLHTLKYAVIPGGWLREREYKIHIKKGYKIQDVVDLFAEQAPYNWSAEVYDSPDAPVKEKDPYTNEKGVLVISISRMIFIHFMPR